MSISIKFSKTLKPKIWKQKNQLVFVESTLISMYSIFKENVMASLHKTELNLSIKKILLRVLKVTWITCSVCCSPRFSFHLRMSVITVYYADDIVCICLYLSNVLHLYHAGKHYWKYYIERLLHFRKITTITTTVIRNTNQWPLRTSLKFFFALALVTETHGIV